MCFAVVLIVEDNPVFRNALKEMLGRHFPSLVIEEASCGEEALRMFQELKPDLIILDIRLPGMNGLELTKAMKNSDSRIDIIILTSYENPEYREAALRNGASKFFTKGTDKGVDIAAAVGSSLSSKGKECHIE